MLGYSIFVRHFCLQTVPLRELVMNPEPVCRHGSVSRILCSEKSFYKIKYRIARWVTPSILQSVIFLSSCIVSIWALPSLAMSQGVPGRVRLGINIAPVTEIAAKEAGLKRPYGAQITGVDTGGAAERSGLKVGDIVLEADRMEIAVFNILPKILASKNPGDTIHLKIWRQRKALELDVKLSSAPESLGKSDDPIRACEQQLCPACQRDVVVFLGRSSDKICDACLEEKAKEISSCAAAVRNPNEAAPAKPATQGTPAAAIVLNKVNLAPSVVPPGGEFALEISYRSSSTRKITFAYAISADGRELYASKPEEIEGSNGSALLYTRSMGAASEPGSYVIRITLTVDGQAVEREVTLRVNDADTKRGTGAGK
jgi:hypothetical protein